MSNANDIDKVKLQYNSDKNLNSRGDLHKHFSTNKYGWFNWVFNQYLLKPNDRIIEFGCGNGAIWQSNKNRIPKNIKVVLTDLSEGMLNSAKKNLVDINEIIDYSVMDIQNITYEDNSFDIAIANHMLYHVPNRSLGINEVSRVLKPDGTFFSTTNGKNNMKGLKDLVRKFDPRIDYASFSVTKEFGLENGAEQLLKHFNSVVMIKYKDSLHITEAKPLVDYVLSLEGHTNILDIITEDRLEDFYSYFANIISSKGSIELSKSSGIFIAKNPKK
jgi:ubiquinone/menaquinone biosynthesis C-methylase UbiE